MAGCVLVAMLTRDLTGTFLINIEILADICRGATILYTIEHPYAAWDNHDVVYFKEPDHIKVE